MARAGGPPKASRKAAAKKRKLGPAALVAKDECRSLIEDVAFFRAARYREAGPGNCWEEDRCAAEPTLRTPAPTWCCLATILAGCRRRSM